MFRSLYRSCRSLSREPVFTFTVVLALALGMGANCAVWMVANAVLFRPLPYADSDRVVQLWSVTADRPDVLGTVSFPDFYDWETRSRSFSALTAYKVSTADLTTSIPPEQIAGASVTVDFFKVLGVQPLLGRTLSAEDKNASVVVLAHSLWLRDFGGRASVLGETAKLSGKPYTVIGVMPATFSHPEPLWDHKEEFWRPIQGFEKMRRGSRFLRVLGRLKAGVDLDDAAAELRAIGTQLAAEFPDTDAGKRIELISLRRQMFGDLYRPLLLLLGVALAVLVVSGANVANLQFARTNSHARDILTRVALGAKLGDLVLWLLGESLLLALAGGAAGLLLGYIVVSALRRIAPMQIRGLDLAVVDTRMIVFGLSLACFSVVLISIPAFIKVFQIATSRGDTLAKFLPGDGRSKHRTQRIVIVAQLAAVLPLLIATLALSRSFFKLVNVDPGFNTSKLLTLRLDLPQEHYSDAEQKHAFFEQLVNATASIPGVKSVALSSSIPLTPLNTDFMVPVSVQRGESANSAPMVYYRVVTDGFFETLGVSKVAGDRFRTSGQESKPRPAIVNTRFAQEYLSGQDPTGHEIFVFLDVAPIELRVVGAVQDIRSISLSKPTEPEIYVPFTRDTFFDMAMIVRTDTPSAGVERSVQSVVATIDKEVALHDVETIEEIIRHGTSKTRFATLLITISCIIALSLSLIGVASIVGYIISVRTKEFAIRLALGVNHAEILRGVMGRMVALSACGILVGLPLATFVGRIPPDLVFGVKPIDLLNFGLSTLILAVGVALGSYFPAKRILRIDPATSLRAE